MYDVEVRPVAECDISRLAEHMGTGVTGKHQERYGRQLKGDVVYFIAFSEDVPVGHALLKWSGTSDEPMASQLVGVPDIEDLFVSERHRCGGIGTRLLKEAEKACLQRGYRKVGLGVSVDNPQALALYERLGYARSDFGEYRESGTYVDEEGHPQSWEEVCLYLISDFTH